MISARIIRKKLSRRIRDNNPSSSEVSKKSDGFFKWGSLIFSVVAVIISYFAFLNSVESKVISNRPYVIVEEIRYSGMPGLERGNSVDNFEVEVLVRNVGLTPAYKSEFKSAMNIYGPEFTNTPDFNVELEKGKIFVNNSVYYIPIKNIRPFSVEDINKLNDKTNFIYVYGILTYQDIFDESHTTKFCFRMDFLGFDGFKFYKSFNDAD
jgi:hypothetical protein